MKLRAIRYSMIVLLAVCINQSLADGYPAEVNHVAAAQDTHVDLYQNIWINPGLARGQTLRYTWANQNDPDPRKRQINPLRIRVRVLAADRSVIAEQEAPAVGAGQFQSFNFNRDEISLPGESPTGRLQTILEATVLGQIKYPNLVLKQGILESFEDSVEVIDNSTGQTTVHSGRGANQLSLDDTAGKERLNPKTFQLISAGKDNLFGIVPGQTLRVSTLNTLEPAAPGEDGRNFKILFAVTLLLSDGSVIARTDEIALDPGDFHSVDFKRADLPLSGEFGERLQTRAKVVLTKFSLTKKTEFPSSVELVDDITGKTTVFISQKPKEIVVVGSK
jgi:hypothetical protein